jgi:hypothetical protein
MLFLPTRDHICYILIYCIQSYQSICHYYSAEWVGVKSSRLRKVRSPPKAEIQTETRPRHFDE